ncbi:hypothetical protein [Caulobacter segnis]|uniref:hypothetical protein n=1 Tax=Caulobacter segnis TaxID=88688 RepID=UPI0026EFEEB7|nr:hypothetical protein [Caulobacter segnis]
MLKVLAWFNANGDGVQALGTVLAYLMAAIATVRFAASWWRYHTAIQFYLDPLTPTIWRVQARYAVPGWRRRRLYAAAKGKTPSIAIVEPPSPDVAWLRGVEGSPVLPPLTFRGPRHVALTPMEAGSPLVGCDFVVTGQTDKPWRVSFKVFDHDTGRCLISRTIAPSKAQWARARMNIAVKTSQT